MLKHAFLPLIALFFALTAVAGKIDTVSVDSPSMHRAVNCLVVVPEKHAAATAERFSVIYLLHGFGGNQRDWLGNVPELTTYADRYNVILVCPDGQNSWYIDSPVKPTVRFETFMTAELLPFVDRQYRTLADRQHRAAARPGNASGRQQRPPAPHPRPPADSRFVVGLSPLPR